VRHKHYLELTPDQVEMIGRPAAIIDCFGILDDARIRRYIELGCEVKGLGRGHQENQGPGCRWRCASPGRATRCWT
jgi:hypothetical protein